MHVILMIQDIYLSREAITAQYHFFVITSHFNELNNFTFEKTLVQASLVCNILLPAEVDTFLLDDEEFYNSDGNTQYFYSWCPWVRHSNIAFQKR